MEGTDRGGGQLAKGTQNHLAAVVDGLKGMSGFRVAGIGIGHDLSRLYPDSLVVSRLEDLAGALFPFLAAQLSFMR
jgi:cobalamin biosynthesis protein CobT